MAWVLELVESLAIIPKQYFKKLESTDEIWEVRVQSGGNAFRLLGFWDSGNFVVFMPWIRKKEPGGSQKRDCNSRRTKN